MATPNVFLVFQYLKCHREIVPLRLHQQKIVHFMHLELSKLLIVKNNALVQFLKSMFSLLTCDE